MSAFVETGISLNIGGILLMSLGAQWYILFNTIAGPIDPHLPPRSHGQPRRPRLATLAPADHPRHLPAYVTGGITASGGAWNASIVAEIVTYGGTTLTATGLGAYIAKATETGDFHQILAGVTVMALYIVGLNRLLWRRLDHLAETRYTL